MEEKFLPAIDRLIKEAYIAQEDAKTLGPHNTGMKKKSSFNL